MQQVKTRSAGAALRVYELRLGSTKRARDREVKQHSRHPRLSARPFPAAINAVSCSRATGAAARQPSSAAPVMRLVAASCLLLSAASAASAAADDIESLSKPELVARVRQLELELQHESARQQQQQQQPASSPAPPPPPARQQLWPELMKTPFMMWNGWLPSTRGLIPGQANNETLYYAAADRLVASGLRDAGYDTIAVTCNGWQRDPVTGRLRANPKTWPNGYKALIDYLHARKLKICAYSDTGGECSHYGAACFATACVHVSSLLTLPSPLPSPLALSAGSVCVQQPTAVGSPVSSGTRSRTFASWPTGAWTTSRSIIAPTPTPPPSRYSSTSGFTMPS